MHGGYEDELIARELDAAGARPSNAEVSRRLGVHRSRVRRVRTALNIPPAPVGRAVTYATRADAMAVHLVRDGEHLAWTGTVNTRTGTPMINWNSTVMPVGRALFEEHYGRPPEGNLRVTCGVRHCVEPTHLADRRIRAKGVES